MNILVTSAGRRNYLLRYFKAALENQGKVFAVDSSATAPALQDADEAFVVPPFSDPGYIGVLRKICRDENIKLVLPLNDLELSILAQEKDNFANLGTTIIVSSPKVIDICMDKWKTYCFLRRNNISTPKTYLTTADAEQGLSNGEVDFPLFVKPRWGTASLFTQIVKNLEELRYVFALSKRLLSDSIISQFSCKEPEHAMLIQEAIEGEEYGLDILNDLEGQYQTTAVRKKISMRAGETDRAITVKDTFMEDIGSSIGKTLCHIGNVDCDLFLTNKGPSVLEMNPRFGGGYPFSHEAGANFPAAIVAWATAKPVNPNWFKIKPGLVMSKYELVMVTDMTSRFARDKSSFERK